MEAGVAVNRNPAYTQTNVCIPNNADWFITHVHDLGFTSLLSSLPPPSPPYELPFGISTRLSRSPQRDPVAVLSAPLSLLAEQTASWVGEGWMMVDGTGTGLSLPLILPKERMIEEKKKKTK